MDNGTRWVGIDLHRRRSQIAVIDEDGELTLSRRIVNDRAAFLELLGDAEGTHVALEATYGWEWLAELLEEAGYDLHLAHPLRTRAIAAARVKGAQGTDYSAPDKEVASPKHFAAYGQPEGGRDYNTTDMSVTPYSRPPSGWP